MMNRSFRSSPIPCAYLALFMLWAACAHPGTTNTNGVEASEAQTAEALVERVQFFLSGSVSFDPSSCTIQSNAVVFPSHHVIIPLREVSFEYEVRREGPGESEVHRVVVRCEENSCIEREGEGRDSFPPHDSFPMLDRVDLFTFVLKGGEREGAGEVMEALRALPRHCAPAR